MTPDGLDPATQRMWNSAPTFCTQAWVSLSSWDLTEAHAPLCSSVTVSNKGRCVVFCFVLFCLGPHPQPMEVPKLGVKSELQLLAYSTATATPDPCCICNLHHCLGQCQILNPLSEARDQTRVLMDTSRVCDHWATMGTPRLLFIKRNCWNMEGNDRMTGFPVKCRNSAIVHKVPLQTALISFT